MDKFNKLLNVYPNKDLQHFVYLLNRMEQEEISIISARAAIENFMTIARLNSRSRVRQPEADIKPKIIGMYSDPCPSCGNKMLVSAHTDIDDTTVVRTAKCKSCQYSVVVEQEHG